MKLENVVVTTFYKTKSKINIAFSNMRLTLVIFITLDDILVGKVIISANFKENSFFKVFGTDTFKYYQEKGMELYKMSKK